MTNSFKNLTILFTGTIQFFSKIFVFSIILAISAEFRLSNFVTKGFFLSILKSKRTEKIQKIILKKLKQKNLEFPTWGRMNKRTHMSIAGVADPTPTLLPRAVSTLHHTRVHSSQFQV
jgi:hypothetical protein